MSRGKNVCEICKKKFTLFNREHICKRCYRNICAECCEGKKIVKNHLFYKIKKKTKKCKNYI